MKRSRPEQLYRILMTLMAALLLGLFLACTVEGVVRLCLYEDPAGLGLITVGISLYFGGELALGERKLTQQSL